MLNFKNILVPTDFSMNSVQALQFGQYFAKQSRAYLHVLHIMSPLMKRYTDRAGDEFYRSEQSKLLDAEEELRRFINKVSFSSVEVVEAIRTGKPFEQIMSYAKDNQIDLIVIASHGWTGLSHLITGSVADKVLRNSDIPTICVKSNIPLLEKDKAAFRNPFAENWVG